jgi:uncharacterized protein
MSSQRPPLPPFNQETAQQKVKAAQTLWNTKSVQLTTSSAWRDGSVNVVYRDPRKVSLAYTEDTIWRNRDQFFKGQDAVVEFLSKKWQKENRYRLRKELFAFQDNKVCVHFDVPYKNSRSASWSVQDLVSTVLLST